MPTPCITSPTPQELAAATQKAREASFGMRNPLLPPPPPPGAVRVHFYSHMYKVIRGTEPDMWADVQLEPNGDLVVGKLCKMWGLENCLAIDPMRWTIQRRPDESRLSGIAVHVLSNELKRAIMFTELPVSKQTARVRASREIALSLGNAGYLFIKLLFDLLMDFFNCCTPVPYWYRKSRYYYTHIYWKGFRENIKYTAIAANNEFTIKRHDLQASTQVYVSEKWESLGKSCKKYRRKCMDTGRELLDELTSLGRELELLNLLRRSVCVIIFISILWLILPLVHKWEMKRAEIQFQREVQLAFQ